MSQCIVMTSSAKMPNACKAPYRNVAVVQLSQEFTAHGLRPKMISERARGVLRVIHFGRFPANGKTEKSGLQKALKEAERVAFEMNNHRELAAGELLINATCA